MKYGLLLLGVIAIVLVVSGCVTSFDSGPTASATPGPKPIFTAVRDNNTSITILFVDPNGAKSVQGLHIDSPSISSPDVIPNGTDVPAGKEIRVTDPNLAGSVQLIASSSVNGTSQVVLNGTL